jgi:hypothetical protein
VNNAISVNNGPLAGPALEQALTRKLSEILSSVGWLGQRPTKLRRGEPDMVVRLELPGKGRAELHVRFKSDIRPGFFQSWARQQRHYAPVQKTVSVLAAPFVSQRLAEVCRQVGWSWYDLAGNCWLDVPGLLRIEKNGLPPAHRPPRNKANLGTAAAARVMRALLTPAHAGRVWTQRALQAQTCWTLHDEKPVSLGLVNKVLHYLREQGFVDESEKSGVRVRDPMGAINAWRDAYRFDRHQRRSFFTLLKGAQLEEALYRTGLDAGGLAEYAAFSAAERQAPQVRQPKTWLYVGAQFVDSLASHAKAKEVDSGENLVVLVPEDIGVFLAFEGDTHVGERRLGCTDPVQTYVDLWQNRGRGEEAAQALLEQRIRPAWHGVGLA